MPIIIKSDESGRFAVHLVSEPAFIQGLRMSPTTREPFLNVGDWVVLAFAIWTSHDRSAIASAIDAVKEMNGRVKLGIRPFEIPEEFSAWCGASNQEAGFVKMRRESHGDKQFISIDPVSGATPMWLIFRDGEIVHSQSGLLSVWEIQDMIARHLP